MLTLCDAACLAWPVCVVTIWPMRAAALLMESGYFEQTFAIIMIIYSKGSFKNYFDKKGYTYICYRFDCVHVWDKRTTYRKGVRMVNPNPTLL